MSSKEKADNGITLDVIRTIARRFPGVQEGISYGTPAFRARGKFFARMYDDGTALVLKVGEIEQEFLIHAEPETYFITDHYRGTPYVLVRLAEISPAEFRDRFEQSWWLVATKRDISAYDTQKDSTLRKSAKKRE